ncbi:Copia protein [Vitis vinifera]|uniref:Copia protein n=1 Tax=Vitis vinifera TaxID=29760 RepID=A0A438IS97_VITVI|nr:Copia protein [Vitis vinifera]
MVMTWFMNSMNEKIDSNYMCYFTAKELWDNDLDLFNDYEWKSTDDANHYKQTMEAYRIYKFLAGLNVEFDEVRRRIIDRVSLPKISKVFAEVRRKESCRHIMLGKESNSGIVESSVLSVAKDSANKTSSFQPGPGERPQNNKPEGRIYRSNPKANATINESKSSPFSKEQMDHLLKMLKSNSLSGIPSVSLAQTDSAPNVFSCCFNSTPWIIDSRASDHMTSFSNLFNTYSPCSSSEKIRITDGSFSPIAGKGLVKLSENIDLKYVLHVPKLACNLLSNSGKNIGSAKLIDGLYYFDGVFSNKRAQGLSSRKTHQKSQSQHVPLGNDKSGPSRTEAPDITGSPTLNLPSIPFISSLDLDIPIALRKGTLTCTKYPIAKYLSYKKLFKTHKAFTSKISHILVPRNIQEALDDPNWKVAVMKEMNALKRSGTWELVDLPKEKRTVVLIGSEEELERLKRRLVAEFEIKDLGALKYFLGMEFGCKLVQTPIESNIKLLPSKDDGVKDKTISKASWDADLLVTYASGYCFCSKHGHGHLQVEAFTDANWAGCVVDRHSTSGYYTFVGGNLVSWRSKKQNVVARSSTEAEFRLVALGICEVLWIRQLLEELKISSTLPMKLCCDNKTTILIAHNLVLHDRTKHVEIDKHFIKEKLKNGLICIPYIPTTEQVADVLTKGIPTEQFDRLIGKLAIEDIFKPT